MERDSDFTQASKKPISLASNITLQPPLSRLGSGPGLLIIAPSEYEGSGAKPKYTMDPEPLQKWAEEGYAVVEIRIDATSSQSPDHQTQDISSTAPAFDHAIKSLNTLPQCTTQGKIGVIVYGVYFSKNNVQSMQLWDTIWTLPGLVAVVSFVRPASSGINGAPLMIHNTGALAGYQPRLIDIVHTYDVSSPSFVLPGHDQYQAGAAGLVHTRSLEFLKRYLGGPSFDLEAIWEEHTLFEFGERDVAKTMSTMVEEPYVNHVPTMTGGVGRKALTEFYREHFIFNNPEDTKLELISRTVGVDRIIDEFIFSLTHDKIIDWLVPGIPPTHKHVRILFTSIVNIRGDRLYHEHIAWDQATVLRQLGLLPEWLPFPYSLPDGRSPAKGKRFEYRVPTAGVETAMKAVDEGSVESNCLMVTDGIREVDDI